MCINLLVCKSVSLIISIAQPENTQSKWKIKNILFRDTLMDEKENQDQRCYVYNTFSLVQSNPASSFTIMALFLIGWRFLEPCCDKHESFSWVCGWIHGFTRKNKQIIVHVFNYYVYMFSPNTCFCLHKTWKEIYFYLISYVI